MHTRSLRWVAGALALLMLLPALLACGGTNEGDTSSGGAGADEDAPTIPADLHFDGSPEIRFIVSGGDSNSGEQLPYRSIAVDEDADMGFEVNKMVSDRNRKVEDRLGVKIVLKEKTDMAALSSTVEPVLLAGLDEYDVISGFEYYDIGLAVDDSTVGTMLNYNHIPEEEMYIDISQPYWDSSLYEQLSLGGASYWVTGDLSQPWVGSIYVTFVNKRMWQAYAKEIEGLAGSGDIYQLVDDGKWTIGLLSELSRLVYIDQNNNEQVDLEDQVGYLAWTPAIGAIMSDGLAGGSHVTYTKWADGVPQVDFNNTHNLEFSRAQYALVYESNALLVDGSETDNYILTTWAEGRSLFTVNLLSNSEIYLADMQDDYYIVPVPKLNEEQKEYSTVTHDSISLYGIPASCPNVSAATATLELMGYYSYKLVTPAYYDAALKERYTRDPQTGAMIDRIRETLYSDFVALWAYEIGDATHYFRSNVNRHFAAEAKTRQRSWQTKLDKVLERIAQSEYIEQ